MMCTIKTPEEERRTLRLVWYLTGGVKPGLRCRWNMNETPLSTQPTGGTRKRNQSVTKACDTEPTVVCA